MHRVVKIINLYNHTNLLYQIIIPRETHDKYNYNIKEFINEDGTVFDFNNFDSPRVF